MSPNKRTLYTITFFLFVLLLAASCTNTDSEEIAKYDLENYEIWVFKHYNRNIADLSLIRESDLPKYGSLMVNTIESCLNRDSNITISKKYNTKKDSLSLCLEMEVLDSFNFYTEAFDSSASYRDQQYNTFLVYATEDPGSTGGVMAYYIERIGVVYFRTHWGNKYYLGGEMKQGKFYSYFWAIEHLDRSYQYYLNKEKEEYLLSIGDSL